MDQTHQRASRHEPTAEHAAPLQGSDLTVTDATPAGVSQVVERETCDGLLTNLGLVLAFRLARQRAALLLPFLYQFGVLLRSIGGAVLTTVTVDASTGVGIA